MSFFNKYPYSDMHELNLDWLIAKMKELNIAFDEFKVVNNITFSGAWDITKQYPAWTIVSDNNIGYVSQQPVPAGIPLTNGNYWVEVIDYTAQIAGLESRVIALEGDVLDINEEIENLKSRKFLFLGDSYYLGGGGLVYTGNGWASQIINHLGLTPDEYILATADDVLYNGGISLPAFYPSAGTHQSFKTILEKVASHVSDEDKLKVSDIVVAGGYNDMGQGGNIETGIIQYVEYAKATFPNAHLWCSHIGYSARETERLSLLTTRDYYRKCIQHGMTYISAAEFVLCDDALLTSDLIHPTVDGYKKIGAVMANILTYGDNSYRPDRMYTNSTLVNDTLYSGGLDCNIYNYGLKQIVFTNMAIGLPVATLINRNTPYKVYFENDLIQPTGTTAIDMTVDLHEQGGSDEFIDCTVTFGQDNTGKYFSIAPSGTGYSKTVESILVSKNSFILPSNVI